MLNPITEPLVESPHTVAARKLQEPTPDQSYWSEARVRAYAETKGKPSDLPLALVEIPGIDLTVPLLDGDDDWTLNRAVGRIQGTGHLGKPGNLGVAGHRDSFFRQVGELEIGDPIRLVTLAGTYEYQVEKSWIVDPSDIEVLDPVEDQSLLTLVTCYPFYYVGNAPQRFIVRAALTGYEPI